MVLSPLAFYKCLADETRLRCLLLIQLEGELCVCELVQALGEIQPKVSRHLAQLRRCGLLVDRRQGQWVYYSVDANLPDWCLQVLKISAEANQEYLAVNSRLLSGMGDRPQRLTACCP